MGFDLNDPEQAEAYRQAQEVALFVKERMRDINPVRVAIAGLILMLLVGLVAVGGTGSFHVMMSRFIQSTCNEGDILL